MTTINKTEKPGVEKPIFIGYPLLHQSGMTFVLVINTQTGKEFIGRVFKISIFRIAYFKRK
jgi:hypothetical protein